MARDDNDRPYDDGQGRPVNPDLTGDVLSPRWSTDDTDEQPAIQVSGNETYILPPDDTPAGDPYPAKDEPSYLEAPYAEGGSYADNAPYAEGAPYAENTPYAEGTQYAESGPYAVSGGYTDDQGASYIDGYPDSQRPVYTDAFAESAAGEYAGDEPSDPRRPADDPDGAGYLPLDRGYEEPEEEPKRGFLGSGWTGSSGDGDDHGKDYGKDYDNGDGEVRRRTRLLLAAAAAVVVLGVGGGWLLTSTSSDDPCAGGRCASVGDLSSPSADEEAETDVPIEEATDTAAPEPEVSETPTTAPTTQTRVRPTRTAPAEPEPEPEPTRTRTRAAEPDPEPSSRATRAPVNEMNEAKVSARPEPDRTEDTESSAPTSDPVTDMPQPEETRRGLLDILFPWG